MQKKTITLLAIAATAVVTGALSASPQPTLAIAFAAQALTLVASALTYVWYKEDVLERRVWTGTEFNGLVISFTLLALPIYFFRSRGAVRGILASLLFYLTVVSWAVLAAGSALLTLAARAA